MDIVSSTESPSVQAMAQPTPAGLTFLVALAWLRCCCPGSLSRLDLDASPVSVGVQGICAVRRMAASCGVCVHVLIVRVRSEI